MKSWLEKIKSLKRDQILILFLAGVLLLVISLPTNDEEVQVEESEGQETVDMTELSEIGYLEKHLQEILSQVEGIGQTEVMITVKSDGKSIVEKDTEQTKREEENGEGESVVRSKEDSSNESTIYQKDAKGNETPYVSEKMKPEIEGVLVIAQGAGDSVKAAEITEAVMALFGVEAHKIKVMKMK